MTGASPREDAIRAAKAASEHLIGLQDAEGWWKGELQTNVTMDAEDLMLRHFLGILDMSTAARAAVWIRSQQGPHGGWATFFGGPGDVSTTVEAYVALRLAGDRPDEPHMARAADWVRQQSGVGASRVFTRIWLAMLGAWDWEQLPFLPPEIMFLPARAPLSIYSFGCWARQTIVALSVVMAHRPARPLPFELRELGLESREAPAGGSGARNLMDPGRWFVLLDRALHAYEGLPGWFAPRRVLRRVALRRAEEWIVRRQEADGSWGGIQPPMVYSVIALHLLGYRLDHPVMKAAIGGMDAFTIDDERGRRVEACQSPVWDTALALVALADSGTEAADPSVRAAREWLLDKEVTSQGDWAVRRPGLAPGGWAFEFDNLNYPDIDDTAEVVMALRRTGTGEAADTADEAIRRGVDWVLGMRSRGGAWGAFDPDNDSRLVAALPFCDFGEVTDPPSADVTAHALEMLAAEPGVPRPVVDRAVRWLLDHQEPDGSWFGRWGVNHLYGTGAVLPALEAAGIHADHPAVRRAVEWIESCQNTDGGWGEDIRSYVDPAWRGRGSSTASQTAWALLALVAAGEAGSRTAGHGVAWLVAAQRPDGTWDEPEFTGTGFPWDFSINYHLYRLVFPLCALGRWLSSAEQEPPS